VIGKTVSHYRIIEKLGEGGMGVVYKAEDFTLGRTVALKFLPPELTRDSEAKTRFVHEAKIASVLDHPNICTIHEIGEEQGKTFIAMAYVEGKTLREKISTGPLKLEEALGITIQIAEGLEEAHEKGIVHRDIKASNIIITPKGQVKIMDFGLAKLVGASKLTKNGATVGTIAYMSPEQARGEVVDHRTDIWSLGAMLYETITGQLPFKGDYEPAVVYSILNETPEAITALRAGVPMDLEKIVEKALAKKRDERYQHLGDMLVDLRAVVKQTQHEIQGRRLISEEPSRKSIAVLPFESLSASKEDEYFSDGTTDDIITQLSKISDLRVISRTSVMSYKGSKKNLRQIGRELGVATILEGSVRRSGDRVRIVSQLIDASTDEHLWADTYDRELRDIFDIQSDVAQRIAAALKAKLSPEEKERIQQKPTENLTAYDFYLKGRDYYYRYTKLDNENAIELFKKALELDPDYALAYAGLGDAYCQRVHRFGFAPGWLDSAVEMSEKAISIDPGCAEAHKTLGLVYYAKGWLRKALDAYRRAVELNPNYCVAVSNIGVRDHAMGQYVDALKWAKKALTLNPTFAFSYVRVALVYWALGWDEQAEAWFNRALELQPDFIHALGGLSYMYLFQGRQGEATSRVRKALSIAPDEPEALCWVGDIELFSGNTEQAEQHYERAMKLSSPDFLTYGCISLGTRLAHVYRKTGRQEQSETLLGQGLENAMKRLEDLNELADIPYEMAAINAIQGKEEEACQWIQKAIDSGWRDYRMASIDPVFVDVREGKQFRQMMAAVKAMLDEMLKQVQTSAS